MTDETRKFFGLSTTGFFAKCTQIQPQLRKIKNATDLQRVNLKLEVVMTPEKLLGSEYFGQGFIQLPGDDHTQDPLPGAEGHPNTGEYRAQLGGEKKIAANQRDWAINIRKADNPGFYEALTSQLGIEGDGAFVHMHPLSGITLSTITPDEDKNTGTPRATFAFMVKGLPSEIAGVEWLLHQIRFEVVEKLVEEVEVENAIARAQKGAKGQKSIEETIADPANLTEEQIASHKKNVEALIDVVDQTAWIKLEEQCGDDCSVSEDDVETVFQVGIAKHGPLDLEAIANNHSPAHFTQEAQSDTDQVHRFCNLMLALYLETTCDVKEGVTA